jgi:hypothetical protein
MPFSRLCELGETYHAAQQASFRGTTWQQDKTTFLFLCGFRFEAETILKMTVMMNGEDGATRPF